MPDDDPSPGLPSLGPIPPEMDSEYEARPFKTCTRCGETLREFREGYRISKVYNRGEVLFEYALCAPCYLGILEESSEETKRALFEYQSERLQLDVGSDQCVLCRTDRDAIENQQYAVVAACLSDRLLDINLVCGPCIEKMNELVSTKTREVWDRFVQENFPGVPSDSAPMPTQPAFF